MNPAIITSLDLALAAPEIFLLTATCLILLIDLFLIRSVSSRSCCRWSRWPARRM